MQPDLKRCLRLHRDMGDTARSFLRSVTMGGPSWYIWSHKGETHLLPPGATIGTSGTSPEASSVGRVMMRFPVDSHHIIAAAAGLVAANGWRVLEYDLGWEIDRIDPDQGQNEAVVRYTFLDGNPETEDHEYVSFGPCPWSCALMLLSEVEQHNRRATELESGRFVEDVPEGSTVLQHRMAQIDPDFDDWPEYLLEDMTDEQQRGWFRGQIEYLSDILCGEELRREMLDLVVKVERGGSGIAMHHTGWQDYLQRKAAQDSS